MSNLPLEIFNMDKGFNPEQARQVLEKPLNPAWIKTRQQGRTNLSYVEGHVVIRLLNLAFNQQWSFEILDTHFVGDPTAKGAYVVVHGRMTVPGLGVREQFGNQAFQGGAMDEHTMKGATTDAMKKCANMFGVALELFGEAEGLVGADIDAIAPVTKKQVDTPKAKPQPTPEPEVKETEQHVEVENNEPPLKTEQPVKPASVSSQWDEQDLNNLKSNRSKIAELAGAETEEERQDNNYLNPYIQEFLESADVDFRSISPSNVKDFNTFLSMKLQGYDSSYE